MIKSYSFNITINKADIEQGFDVKLTDEQFYEITKTIEASLKSDTLYDKIRYHLENIYQEGDNVL